MSTARATRKSGARTFGLFAMSVSAHVIYFSVLGLVPPPSEVLAMREAEFEFIEPEPVEEPPEPEPEPPEPEPEPEPEPKRAPKQAQAPEPEPEPVSDEPPVEEVADFTGETLVGSGPGGWSTVVGSGAPLKGPVGKIGNKQGKSQNAPAAKAVKGPKFVPAKSLKRRPVMPSGFNAALERNYPSRARMQGVEGTAVATVRILPNGRLGKISISRQTPAGYDFDKACRRTLREMGAWQAPLGSGGEAVATEIKFTCTFEVTY